MGNALRCAFLLLSLLACSRVLAEASAVPFAGRESALKPEQIAVVVNDADLDSQEVGAYYLQARQVPPENLVHVNIPGKPHKLSVAQFDRMRQEIQSQLGPGIEALVLIWTAPYAVECNSITSALTMGYDAAQCKNSCAAGRRNFYFNSRSRHPQRDFGMRLSMLLPVETVAQAKALLDRGVMSEFRMLPAGAYFLTTTDEPRNARVRFYPKSGTIDARRLTIHTMQANTLSGTQDIMLYQIGLPIVPNLDTLKFLPGALADHLTSFGGDLLGQNGQMSSLRWLEAGATASYGTVSEPCNHWQKFPQPQILLKAYLSGASAIEAYWKSVAWPTQGLFVGEPLAAPYHR